MASATTVKILDEAMYISVCTEYPWKRREVKYTTLASVVYRDEGYTWMKNECNT